MQIKLIISVFLLLVDSAFGQAVPTPQGAIQETVADQSGDPLPGANVVLKGSNSSAPNGMTTDLEGRYRLGNLRDGTYQIAVSYIGYKTSIDKEVSVTDGGTIEMDVILRSEAIF